MLNDMLRVFGSRQIRNRATMGGNIVTASPIGDSAPCLLALDAKVMLASESGERTLSIGEFFLAYRKTAMQPGEVLKTILIPRGISAAGLARKTAWFKVSKRREMDISTVAGAFVVDLVKQNIVRNVRLDSATAALPQCRRARRKRKLHCSAKLGAKKRFKARCRFCRRSSRPFPMCAGVMRRNIGTDS